MPGLVLAPPGGPTTQPATRTAPTTAVAASPGATQHGVCVAFNDPWNAINPTWTRLDDPAGVWTVTSWSIDRGRTYELDKTGTGTATVNIIDIQGLFDPTNSTSPFYGLTDPLKQAMIALDNPTTGTPTTMFRGFIEDWDYTLDVSAKFMTLQLRLVDALDLFAATEVVPGQHGDTSSSATGDVVYLSQPVDDRIRAGLADAGWPEGYSTIFTGNVNVQDVVYAPRSSILSVIQDAADAEFPAVANFYIAKTGEPTFHGRLARFNPSAYGLGSWTCGDTAAASAATTSTAIVSGLSFNRGLANIHNAALVTPQGIADADIAGQLSYDSGSIATYGARTWSAENLITLNEQVTGTTANPETKKYGDFVVSNNAAPRTRISQITFRPQDPASVAGVATWSLICGVEISDTVTVTTTHPGGGGFNAEPYFVEGVHYDARPLSDTMHEVTLTLDISPAPLLVSPPAFDERTSPLPPAGAQIVGSPYQGQTLTAETF